MKKILLFTFFILILSGCNKKDTDNFIGKWNTVKAINATTGEETNNLTDVFGSSFLEFGSFLELKEDGTFIDALESITDGSKSNTGSYTVKNDYLKVGDTYIFLSYDDGGETRLQKVTIDKSGYYLVVDSLINDYQLYLKKN